MVIIPRFTLVTARCGSVRNRDRGEEVWRRSKYAERFFSGRGKKPPSRFHLTAASCGLFCLILSKLQGGVQFEEQ